MKILTRSDEILMLAILRLKNDANGVSIIKDVQERTGKKLTFGSLWVSMDILYKRGFVKKRMSDPTPQRGGRSKIYYNLTPKGLKVLEEAREFQKSLWEGVPAQLKTWFTGEGLCLETSLRSRSGIFRNTKGITL